MTDRPVVPSHCVPKILIYAEPAVRSSAGIEKYARALIQGLCRLDCADRFVFLSSVAMPGPEPGGGHHLACRTSPRWLRYSWSFAGVPYAEDLAGIDLALVHSPANIRIPTRKCPLVVTVHDVFPTKQPQLMTLRQRLALTRQIESRGIRAADYIIADSESTKRDICELFDQPGEKVTVIPLGVDHALFRPERDPGVVDKVMHKYGVVSPFVLYVGSLYSRKIGRLLEAFRTLPLTVGKDVRLVIVGGRSSARFGEPSLPDQIRALGLEQLVTLTGTVPEAELPALMTAAEVFVYVSFYEGFGLSVLEAMACGAAVVVSNVASLPEIVGKAGILVNPYDTEEISTATARVLQDGELRHRLRTAAFARSAGFSWDRTVESTLAVYRRFAVQSGARR